MSFHHETDFYSKLKKRIEKMDPDATKYLGEFVSYAVSCALNGFGDVISAKDRYTWNHVYRTHFYAELLLEHNNSLGLNSSQKNLIMAAARLHDLGKIEIEDRHLKGDYTYNSREEFLEIFGGHPECSAKILYRALKPFISDYGGLPIAVLFHHFDFNAETTGNGYPKIEDIKDDELREYVEHEHEKGPYKGFLKEKQCSGVDENLYRIFIGVLRVLDTIDAAVSIRKYKQENDFINMEGIISEIITNSKGIYHPDVVTALHEVKGLMIKKDITKLANIGINAEKLIEEAEAQNHLDGLLDSNVLQELEKVWPAGECEIKEKLVAEGLLRKRTQTLAGVTRIVGWDLTTLGENVLRLHRSK
jgi:hypothetical protein